MHAEQTALSRRSKGRHCEFRYHVPLSDYSPCRGSRLFGMILCSVKDTLANTTDPDQMPHNATSDQDLHCAIIHINTSSERKQK